MYDEIKKKKSIHNGQRTLPNIDQGFSKYSQLGISIKILKKIHLHIYMFTFYS